MHATQDGKQVAWPGMLPDESDPLLPQNATTVANADQAADGSRLSITHETGNAAIGQVVAEAALTPMAVGEHVLTYQRSGTASGGGVVIHRSFYASKCEVKRCPTTNDYECSGNGVCIEGNCMCSPGYAGTRCNHRSCEGGCEHGTCDEGLNECECAEGWAGATCSVKLCSGLLGIPCSGVGTCVNGACLCDAGFAGDECETKLAHPKCEDKATWSLCPPKCTYTCGDVNFEQNCSAIPESIADCRPGCMCPPEAPVWDTVNRRCGERDQCSHSQCGIIMSTGTHSTQLAVNAAPCRNKDHSTCVCAHKSIEICYIAQRKWIEDILSTGGDMGVSLHYDDGTFPGKMVFTDTLPGNVSAVERTLLGRGSDMLSNVTTTMRKSLSNAEILQTLAMSITDTQRLVVPRFGSYQIHLWRRNGETGSIKYERTVDLYAQNCPETDSEMVCPGGRLGEGECSAHGSCHNRTCLCDPGWTGEDCGTPIECPGGEVNPCSGHGTCLGRVCHCSTGWDGDDCGRPTCPANCTGHGVCVDGVCVCEAGWAGSACRIDTHSFLRCVADVDVGQISDASLLVECSGHGSCDDGVCSCEYGWSDRVCDRKTCPGYPNECSQRGECVNGACMCQVGWTGPNCNQPTCPTALTGEVCSGHGECLQGHCECRMGWMGVRCDKRQCPGDPMCGGPSNGQCNDGACVCVDGWKGVGCSIRNCPVDSNGLECSGRGDCDSLGHCSCYAGWRGDDCSSPKCAGDGKEQCSGHGMCTIEGECQCDAHWTGPACDVSTCTNHQTDVPCSGNGECLGGECACDALYTGTHCTVLVCPAGDNGETCSGRGICDGATGQCECQADREGAACDMPVCPNGCTGHGACRDDGTCACDPFWQGEACSLPTSDAPTAAAAAARARAMARNSRLALVAQQQATSSEAPTLAAEAACASNGMSYTPCLPASLPSCLHLNPPESNHGCVGGCVCGDGFVWDHGAGACVDPSQCSPEFSAGNCTDEACGKHGHCGPRERACECDVGWAGDACERLRCPSGTNGATECSGHGSCDNDGQCVCNTGFVGRSCSKRACEGGCGTSGLCFDGACKCTAGFMGRGCKLKLCPRAPLVAPTVVKTHRNGSAELAVVGGSHALGGLCGGPGNGICNTTSGTCRCHAGRTGPACTRRICPNSCSTNGDCDPATGLCKCERGWRGSDCSLPECPNDCSGRGTCDATGSCRCFAGFHTLDCSQEGCPVVRPLDGGRNHTRPMECGGQGVCVNGRCKCSAGYTGEACNQRSCPHNCTHHGQCVKGTCLCAPGRMGIDCSRLVCSSGCSGQGACGAHGECVCYKDWTGVQCADRQCPGTPPCNGLGACVNSTCSCALGHAGETCEINLPTFPIRVAVPSDDVNISMGGDVTAFEAIKAAVLPVGGPKNWTSESPGDNATASRATSVAPGVDMVPCAFPFHDRLGRSMVDCAAADAQHPRGPWCPIARASTLSSDGDLQEWGYCLPSGVCAGEDGDECSGNGACRVLDTPQRGVESYCECAPGFKGINCARRIARVVVSDDRDDIKTGQPCIFPFVYKGSIYHDCTSDHSEQASREWCALSGQYSKGLWGFCAPPGTCPGETPCSGHGVCHDGLCTCDPGYLGVDCHEQIRRVTTGFNLKPAGQKCAFPFSFGGIEYNNCTLAPTNEGDYWCALKSEEFVLGETPWDFCAPLYTCPGSPQCSGHGSCDLRGSCVCDFGYGGEACNYKTSLKLALAMFYDATNGLKWDRREGWLTVEQAQNATVAESEFCEWYGIECDDQSRIIRLRLKANDLHGTIPREVALLSDLVTLDISSNHLGGTIPSELGRMTALQSLRLSNNALVGTIPETLLDIDPISHIAMSENFLTGDGAVPQMIEHLIHSSFQCDNNCIVSDVCSRRIEGCPNPGAVGAITDQQAANSNVFTCVCEGGIAAAPGDPMCTKDGTEACVACNDGFHSAPEYTCAPNRCICPHGKSLDSGDPLCILDGGVECVECDEGFDLDGSICVERAKEHTEREAEHELEHVDGDRDSREHVGRENPVGERQRGAVGAITDPDGGHDQDDLDLNEGGPQRRK